MKNIKIVHKRLKTPAGKRKPYRKLAISSFKKSIHPDFRDVSTRFSNLEP